MPSDFKPMLNVGPGAYEIACMCRGSGGVIYVAKFEDGIYVYMPSGKRRKKDPRRDIELAARRYRQIGV